MARVSLQTARARHYDLAIVGAGASGLALANSACKAGLSVLLVERGGPEASTDPEEPQIAPASPHDPNAKTIRQGLGGTLDIWGGRCVPFDRTDFDRRPGGAPGWPISYEDYAPWIAPAAAFLGVEPVFERAVPAHWGALETVRLDSVERLGPGRLIDALRDRALADLQGPDLLLDSLVTGFAWADRSVSGLCIATDAGQKTIAARQVVLACGGLQSTRLLLLEHRRQPGRIAGHEALGKTYMGHLTGSISEITFRSAADAAAFAYIRDNGGTPARRRFLLTPETGNHVAFWVENLGLADPRNRSGELSLKAMASGSAPYVQMRAHLGNVLHDPGGAFSGVASAIQTRLMSKERHANRLVTRGPGPYRLAYHAEHLPFAKSRVGLSETCKPDGMPGLYIDFDYGSPTIRGTVTAHRVLARALEASGLARLDLSDDDTVLEEAVRVQARDGYHQIGLTRMADHPRDGVVDRDLRVYGTQNLYIASASTFPVASQANPTLSIVALALRLSERLVGQKTTLERTEMVS